MLSALPLTGGGAMLLLDGESHLQHLRNGRQEH